MAESGDLVLLEVREAVAVITLNRPEVHNAISDAMRGFISRAFDEAAAREDVRCVLLRGAGKSFCAGRDVRELGARGEGVTHEAYIAAAQAIRLKQYELRKPSVAALRGHVIGGGAEMALAADVRVVAEDLRFSLPEVRYGLALDTGGSAMLTALLGPARAKWLMMSGDPIGAQEAVAWGLAEWSVPPEALDARAFEIARRLASLPPGAVAAQKGLVEAVLGDAVRTAMARELAAQSELFLGDEYLALKRARTEGRDSRD
jgi:enoyl-CoA hydratase